MAQRLGTRESVSAWRREAERLGAELAHCQEQVEYLRCRAEESRAAERERLALELHDGVAQTLASAHQHLQALQGQTPGSSPLTSLAARAAALVRQALAELRELMGSQPPSPLSRGLVPAIQQELAEFQADASCAVEFVALPLCLDPEREMALYRIFREALNNVRKHAQAPRLRVELGLAPPHVVLQVQDWGKGFDTQSLGMVSFEARGLTGMKRRAHLLGGLCEVESAPGQGTIVRCRVPAEERGEVPLGAYSDSHR